MTTVILKEKRCKNLLRSIILLSTLLLATLPARAADYVFMYDGGYLAVNNSGAIIYTTTFSPQCV